MMTGPFWRFYGGKWRAAPRYPKPTFDTIVEPFAGAAGYSMRHHDRKIVLVDKDPIIAGIWRYLIDVRASEILRIPVVDHVDELPTWVSQPARWLVGFSMNAATTAPRKSLSSGRRKLRDAGRKFEGWSTALRERIARQVDLIRHWQIIDGDFSKAPTLRATWFVDGPYQGRAGSFYTHGSNAIDYAKFAKWCLSREGQTIVCENEGATWLPFKTFATFKAGVNHSGSGSREVIWTNTDDESVKVRPQA